MIVPKERITKNVIDFAGGLGDVLNVFYLTDAYQILKENKNTLVLMRSHNKHVTKFLQDQGYANIIDLSSAWDNSTGEFYIEAKDKLQNICRLDLDNINLVGIKRREFSEITHIPDPKTIIFNIDKKEQLILDLLKDKNIIPIHPTAGSLDRNMPDIILYDILDKLVALNFTPVIIGSSNHEKKYRKEVINLEHLNMSIGFSIELVKLYKYFIGTHSSMNLVAWHNNIKSLILMSEMTFISHFFDTLEEKTVWNFGAFNNINNINIFSFYHKELINNFLG
jgi:hypothetical protein